MMTRTLSSRRGLSTAAVLGLVFAAARTSTADTTLYATSQISNQILQVDLTTNTVTPVLNANAPVDSLIFDTHGNIIYSENTVAQVWIFNPITHSNTMLASFAGGSSPADLALEPSGNSVLVSLFGSGMIDRIDLTTHGVSMLGNYGGNPEGLAFDSQGNLFANLGVRDSGNDKYVAQINPTTGAIIATSAHYSSLDGLTYDSFSDKLYSASLDGNYIVSLNPSNLSSSILTNSGVPNPDGIEADGHGLLYAASRNNYKIYNYNLTTNALTAGTFVNGLDDIAPVSGLGAPTPEPSSMALFAGMMAMTGLATWLRRRRTNE